MGRSQVLYNRTKGRNRNRAGRGGDRTEEGSRSGRTGNHHRHRNDHGVRRQPLPKGSLGRQEKDYEHEYEVLFAGRDTYLGTQHPDNNINNPEDEDPSWVGGTGSICLPSMAAALESMPISKRLRIPLHVAATAFPARFREETNRRNQEEEAKRPWPEEQEPSGQPAPTESVAAVADNGARGGNATGSELSSSNLEDWLDDACGIPDDNPTGRQSREGKIEDTTQTPEIPPPFAGLESSSTKVTFSSTGASSNSKASGENSNTNNLLAKAEEEFGDENLDDWLDSVIE